jgi:hypothetical protein
LDIADYPKAIRHTGVTLFFGYFYAGRRLYIVALSAALFSASSSPHRRIAPAPARLTPIDADAPLSRRGRFRPLWACGPPITGLL